MGTRHSAVVFPSSTRLGRFLSAKAASICSVEAFSAFRVSINAWASKNSGALVGKALIFSSISPNSLWSDSLGLRENNMAIFSFLSDHPSLGGKTGSGFLDTSVRIARHIES